MQPTEMCIW